MPAVGCFNSSEIAENCNKNSTVDLQHSRSIL